MPKQRNHPHHHARSERRGDHLELPQRRFAIDGLPNIIYPRGWKTKWPNEQIPFMVVSLAIMGIAVAFFLLLAFLMMLFSH